MSSTPRPKVSPFCFDLMSKKIVLAGVRPLDEEQVLDASNHCWCARTSQILGPDREPAHPADCRAGRGCFRSPLAGILERS